MLVHQVAWRRPHEQLNAFAPPARGAGHAAAPSTHRYLSRFLVVVIALSIETLVMTFELGHEDPTKLPYAGAIGLTAAVLLIAWGAFVKFNRVAEDLEPEAMAEAKQEDDQAQ